ncbi:MAG: EAL domain-containing response regulator [Pseudomonadota bacterium]
MESEPPTQSTNVDPGTLDREFLAQLPKTIADLGDRWYIVRQRGCRPQDLMEIRGITRALVSGLTGSPLEDSLTTARRIDERLAQYANTTLQPSPAELETIGALVLRLRDSVQNELPLLPDDDATSGHDRMTARPLVWLYGDGVSPESETALLLGIHGLAVRACGDEDALADPGESVAPDVLIAESAANDEAALAGLVALRDRLLPEVPLVILLAPGEKPEPARLQALRAGADAVLPRPLTDLDLIGAIRALAHTDDREPYRVLLIAPETPPPEATLDALNRTGCVVTSEADPAALPEQVAATRPDAILLAGGGADLRPEDIHHLLLPLDFAFDIPVLAIDPEADQPHTTRTRAPEGILERLPSSSPATQIVRRIRALAAWHRRVRSPAHPQAPGSLSPALDHPKPFEHLLTAHLDRLDPAKGTVAILQLAFDDPDKLRESLGTLDHQQVRDQAARKIHTALQPEDLLISHADSSLIAIVQRGDPHAVAELARELHEILCRPSPTTFGSTALAASIGVAQATRGKPDKSLERANALCAEARNGGGNRVQLDPALLTPDLDSEQRSHWRRTIAHAIKEKRLFLVYQPIANISGSDAIERHEVLLRIREPDGRIQLPGQFVEMAERLELDRHLDRWVLSNVLAILSGRTDTHPRSRLFVKISRGSLADPGFLPWLRKGLEQHPVRPGSLVLELREADVLAQLDQMPAFRDALHDLELGIALEHFGASTDADTRRMLAELRPDYVKIARELTMGLHHAATPSARLVPLLVQAKEVGAYTMAGYVEDADGLALLWQTQIDLVQGNFIREPETELRYELEFPGQPEAP